MRLIKITFVVLAIGIAGGTLFLRRPSSALAQQTPAAPAMQETSVAPDEAMRLLREGNDRFVQQKATNSHRDAARRAELAGGQHPFAVVLGCADSRVPPEVIFDQGLGDLFVIRVAGEVAPPEVIGSIEYAVDHLHCRTIIVLGHERCGAVEAALSASADGAAAPEGNLGELIKDITPVIQKIDRKSPDALDLAVRANALAVAQTLVARSTVLKELAEKGEIVITPGRYDLDSGKVEFMEKAAAGGGR